MDRNTIVDGPPVPAKIMQDRQEAVAWALGVHQELLLDGCMMGLLLDLAGPTLSTGVGFLGRDLIRVRAAESVPLATVVRPPSGQHVWVMVSVSYRTVTRGTVVDDTGGQHPAYIDDSALVTITRGVNAPSANAAVRPDAPLDGMVVGDVLLDHDTALASLTVDQSRRTKCEHERLRDDMDELAAQLRSLLNTPNPVAAPTAASLNPFTVQWSWVRESGLTFAIDRFRLQWRYRGDPWPAQNVHEVSGTSLVIRVPNANRDVEARVQAHNARGWGGFGPAGRIAAGDIQSETLRSRRFDASANYVWPFRTSQRARLVMNGGDGGRGEDGTDGSAGRDATSSTSSGRHETRTVRSGYYRTVSFSEPAVRTAGGFWRCNRGTITGLTPSGGTCVGTERVWVPPETEQVWVPGSTTWTPGADGADGDDGRDGSAGEQSRVQVVARGIDETASGGSGGDGGDGGEGGRGGRGANGRGAPGGEGSAGSAGESGATRTVDVAGLQHGDQIIVTVGAGGAGYPAGAAGYVEITPL